MITLQLIGGITFTFWINNTKDLKINIFLEICISACSGCKILTVCDTYIRGKKVLPDRRCPTITEVVVPFSSARVHF